MAYATLGRGRVLSATVGTAHPSLTRWAGAEMRRRSDDRRRLRPGATQAVRSAAPRPKQIHQRRHVHYGRAVFQDIRRGRRLDTACERRAPTHTLTDRTEPHMGFICARQAGRGRCMKFNIRALWVLAAAWTLVVSAIKNTAWNQAVSAIKNTAWTQAVSAIKNTACSEAVSAIKNTACVEAVF